MKVTFSFPQSGTEMTALAEVMHLCFLNRTPAGDPRRVMVGMGVRFTGFASEEKTEAAETILVQNLN